MRNHKIAQFILSMGVGGGERLVRMLSQQIRIAHTEHCVVCFDGITAYQDEFAREGVPLRLIKRRQCALDWKIIAPLIRYIREENIRLIHAHDLSALTYAVAAGKLCGAKVIMTEHSRHYVDASWKRRFEKRLFIMAADCLVEVSPDLQDASTRRDGIPASRIEVIENGVDIDTFKNARPLPLHQIYGIPSGTPLILTVGRLETIKGQQHLLRALVDPMLKTSLFHLFFAGDGSNKDELARMANELGLRERIHFLGARHDVAELMASCDVLVIPSESEGLPFVLLEAMAAGIPVITTAVGRIPAIIGNNERGMLVTPRKPKALADAFMQIMDNKAGTNRMTESGAQFVREYYSKDAMLSGYKKIYEKFL